MADVIRMPRMSDTMEEGNLVGWLKEEGDQVEAGDTLAEVETDKATMELDSFRDGVLLHIAIKEGSVPINGVIAVIGEEGEDWKAALAAASEEENESSAKPEPAAETSTPEAPEAESPKAEAPVPEANSNSDDKRVKASPLARSIAKDAGVDINRISGSGDQGRIVRRDVESFVKEASSSPASAPKTQEEAPAVQPFAFQGGAASYEDKPVSQMRKTIARRLGESKFTAPHFYLTVEIDMDKSILIRKQLNEVSPVKLSFNDLVIKAVAAALRQHPAVNSSWLGDKIRYNRDINIGVAVAVDEGLMVPVVRHADMKTLSQVNQEVKALAEKARDRKLGMEEMQGNTFTISNLGMFGIEEFTAIINPPDACILAVSGIVEKPVVKNGEIQVGNRMKVTLSCDHRVVDGATGAKFLATFKEILEEPVRLLV